MNQRERLLATVTVGMLALVVAAFLVTRLMAQFDQRRAQLSQLELDVQDQDRIIKQGKLAADRLKDFAARSLPSDRALARSLYNDWLLDRAVKAGFEDVKVSPQTGRPQGDVYYMHGFLVSGQGNLQELTTLLHEFFSQGFLHRIARLVAKPIPKSKDLEVTISVECLSMNKASTTDKLPEPKPIQLAHADLANYTKAISSRNVFGAENNPPQFRGPRSQSGNPGRSVTFRAEASDPDTLDRLTYEIDGKKLEGASIDSKTGEFRWTPRDLGEYEVSIRVLDDGIPPKSDVQSVKISVVEPPPPSKPPAAFDSAKFSFLTAITESSGRWQIWVTIRTEGRVVKLFEGEKISIGSIQGTISRIDTAQAEIKTDDGRVIVVVLGKSLRPDQTTPLGSAN